MTDAPARRTRLSKGRVRAVAWVAGGATFLTGIGILGISPKPASSAARPAKTKRPVVIVRTIVRRVIVTDPAPGTPVRVSQGSSAPGGSTGGASSSAPTPAPVTTTTGGS